MYSRCPGTALSNRRVCHAREQMVPATCLGHGACEPDMKRTYTPCIEKHKHPKGFGSLCPSDMPEDLPAELLEIAVKVEGVGAKKLWAARGDWCFCAHPSPGVGEDAWHGFPVIGGDVEERVLHRLEEIGQISARERRRLRRQKELPGAWQ